ncbi:MAG: hypothetical protein WDM90_21515 [Ferruginibacter sp.]
MPHNANISNSNFSRPQKLYYKGIDTILAFSPYFQKVATIVNNKIISVENQKIEEQGLFFINLNYALPAPAYITGTNYISSWLSKEKWNLEKEGLIGAVYKKDTFMVAANDGIGIYNSKGSLGKIRIADIDPSRIFFINSQIIYVDKSNHLNYYTVQGQLKKRTILPIPAVDQLNFFNNGLDNNFYCVTNNTLYRITIGANLQVEIQPLIHDLQNAKDISVVYEKDSNTVVVGTRGDGLYVYKKKIFFNDRAFA